MKLKGSYKGKRKRKTPPAIMKLQCPGCNWKSRAGKFEQCEKEYLGHLMRVHYCILHCVFCNAGFPDFASLALHVGNECQKKTVCEHGLKNVMALGTTSVSAKNALAAQLCHGLVQLASRFGTAGAVEVSTTKEIAGTAVPSAAQFSSKESQR
jgi:hypothetical protein